LDLGCRLLERLLSIDNIAKHPVISNKIIRGTMELT
jgi:hypothetical protein